MKNKNQENSSKKKKKQVNNFSRHIRRLLGKTPEIPHLKNKEEGEISFEELKKKVPEKYFMDNNQKTKEDIIVENFYLFQENMNLVREIELLKVKLGD